MPNSSWVQSSFLGGEWSPFAQGRLDLPSYRTALNVCRNSFPIEEGAWIRRSGTKFAAATYQGKQGRVIKFDFEKTYPYIMEFTDSVLRMFGVSTQTGGLSNALPLDFRLVTTNDNQQILNISSANPAVVQTTTAHGWTSGDQVVFLFGTLAAANQTPLLCNRVFTATVTDPTHVSIADSITGATIDGSTLGWSGAVAGAGTAVIARVFKSSTVYAASAWKTIRPVQAETQSFLLHGSYAPYVLSATALPTSSSFATFSLAKATFTDGPYLDPPIDSSTLTPSGTTGSITLTASAITSINGGAGFATTDVGRLVRVRSEPAAWASGTTYAKGDPVKYNGVYFISLQGANTGNQPDVFVAFWAISSAAATWSWATITAWTSTTVVTATINGAALKNTNAIVTWRLGVYSDTTGYPTCGVYYEGRLWLSGAVANRIDGSVVNAISGGTINMAPTAVDGAVADNNAIAYVFNASDVNPVYWMIGTNTGIICGTLAGEWVVSAPTTGPVTATNIQAHRVTTYGCANIEPVHSELTVCFVQRFNRRVLEYFSDVFSTKYSAPNLTRAAKHLTRPSIQELRYQQELLPIIWARNGDGSLIGATYKRSTLFSSQGPEFVGWHRHDLGSTRQVESIEVGPSTDGTIDTLAMVTNDSSTNVRHVELMTSMFDVNDPITSGWFVDDAIVPSGGVITYDANLAYKLTLNGLWHLNGKTVTVVVGGLDCGDVAVTNGSVTVPIDADPLNPAALTSTYLASISSSTAYGPLGTQILKAATTYTVPCMVGFTYTSQGQMVRPDTQEQSRSPTGPGLAKPSRIYQFGALLSGTQGISFGTDFTKMHAAQFKTGSGKAYTPLQLFSGVFWDVLQDDWNFDTMLCWQVSRPYPAAVCSIGGFMAQSER